MIKASNSDDTSEQASDATLPLNNKNNSFYQQKQPLTKIIILPTSDLRQAPLHLAALPNMLVVNLLIEASLATAGPSPLYPITLQSKTFAPLLLNLAPLHQLVVANVLVFNLLVVA